jgi:ribosomal protein L3 glutamine methyltransferase
MMKSIGQWVNECERAMRAGGVVFGHGTDNARDESAWLVLHVMGQPLDGSFTGWNEPVPDGPARRIQGLLERRLSERKPLAYLLGEAWFCGLRFLINENVLVPRSPLAELIDRRFQPWVRPERIRRVLDLCTGSGCIGIAVAHKLPEVRVHAVDISEEALEVAANNVALHGLGDRVMLLKSDLFESLGGRRYDLIVSNPPYVSGDEIEAFPAEYSWEPRLGFHAEEEGLQIVLDILHKAPAHLEEGGILVCEVGEAADRLQARLPSLPLTWLEFEHGGGGVFTIDREALVRGFSD